MTGVRGWQPTTIADHLRASRIRGIKGGPWRRSRSTLPDQSVN